MEEEDGGRKATGKDEGSDELQVSGGGGREHSGAGCASRTGTARSVTGKNSEGLLLIAPRTSGHRPA